MRLVATFPTQLTPEAVHHIRKAFDELSESEWRTFVLTEGGFVYDLDQPLTVVIDNTGRTTVEQQEPYAHPKLGVSLLKGPNP